MNTARAADSFTILQAHQVRAAGVTFIEDGDGSTGVFGNDTGKRLGTLVKGDAMTTKPLGFWWGALFGFCWAGALALIVCRYWLPLHA